MHDNQKKNAEEVAADIPPSVEEPQPLAEQASQAAERSEARLVEAEQSQHSENFSDTKSNVAQSEIKGKAVVRRQPARPGHFSHPKTWRYNPSRPEDHITAIERDMATQSARYRSSGIYQGLLINRSLSPMPLAQQYVSPREEYGEIYIAMLSKEEPRRMVIVRLDKSTGRPVWSESEKELARSMEPFAAPLHPISPETLRHTDMRKSNRPVDVWTTDNPANDTKKIFLQQFETMARIHGTTWEDGQHLSPATREKGGKCISTAKSLITPGEMADTTTLTFRGHQHLFNTPPGVGAGWGDYDRFAEWQSAGRQVKPDMVEKKEWLTEVPETFSFVSKSDPTKITTVNQVLDLEDVADAKLGGQPPVSLYDKVHQRTTKATASTSKNNTSGARFSHPKNTSSHGWNISK